MRRGWMSNGTHVAHYFIDGRSACHRWWLTTADKPAPGYPGCAECRRALESES